MHLVLGLGNPGRRYTRTRHNAGFLVADRVGARGGVTVDCRELGALTARVCVEGQQAVIAKPQSLMNRSGHPAASLRGHHRVDLVDVIAVHDELDLPFGHVRVKVGGGHNGHNGLRDLQAKLGGNAFVRVRVGISRPGPEQDTADYVLGSWTSDEEVRLDAIVDRAAQAVECVVTDGAAVAMNTFNVRTRREVPQASVDPSKLTTPPTT